MYKCICGNEISFNSISVRGKRVECRFCGTVIPEDIIERIITGKPSIIIQIHLNKFGNSLTRRIFTKEISINNARKISKIVGFNFEEIKKFVDKYEKPNKSLSKIRKSR